MELSVESHRKVLKSLKEFLVSFSLKTDEYVEIGK